MRLQDIATSEDKFNFELVSQDKDLTQQIQARLIALGFLEPPVDGKLGPITAFAVRNFQRTFGLSEFDFIGKETAEKLIETTIEQLPKEALILGNDFASRVVKYMLEESYLVFAGSKELNIVYVEGSNSDGSLNSDFPNHFNDLRLVIEIENRKPVIIGNWQATTEPGNYYTRIRPMNAKGAARVKFGQYKAWRVGTHGNSEPHESLIQVAPVTVHRDFNRDFKRTNDNLDTGLFGINQHWGYDYPVNDIRLASAGCLVGRTRKGHREFMSLIKQDSRYLANRDYVYYSTIVPGNKL